MRKIGALLFFVFMILFSASNLSAQGTKPGMPPPAAVVVSEVKTGFVAPEAEFVGTVFYIEVSDVAAEVNGSIEVVSFEEGERIKAGHVLVRLNADLLEKNLKGTKASYEQALSELEKARKEELKIAQDGN